MDTRILARKIFQLIKPGLKKHRVNGTIKYESIFGLKSEEALIASIESILVYRNNFYEEED